MPLVTRFVDVKPVFNFGVNVWEKVIHAAKGFQGLKVDDFHLLPCFAFHWNVELMVSASHPQGNANAFDVRVPEV
jgi:hypothetical protein